jgi:hypothetical protein
MNTPLIGALLYPGYFSDQPRAMIAVTVDKLDMSIWPFKFVVISFRAATVFNVFCSSKNRGKVFRVKG